MRRLVLGLMVACSFASIARPQSSSPAVPQGHPSVITNPQWIKTPSADDLHGVWPEAAARKGVGGKAVISCTVTTEGLLSDCQVVSESPRGDGFGAAAVLLAARMQMRPKLVDGKPVGDGVVLIPFDFTNPIYEDDAPQLGTHIPEKKAGVLIPNFVIWENAPTRADFLTAYQQHASATAPTGHVVVACRLRSDRRLKNCETASEDPKGHGFSAAARQLVEQFVVSAETLGGQSADRIAVNLSFFFNDPAASAGKEITSPQWVRFADGEGAHQFFPDKAAAAGLATGRASLDCIADAHGFMTACKVGGEDPPDMDFGVAGLKVAAGMGVNPWIDGQPAEGFHVKFAVRINRDDATTSKPGAPGAAQPPKRP